MQQWVLNVSAYYLVLLFISLANNISVNSNCVNVTVTQKKGFIYRGLLPIFFYLVEKDFTTIRIAQTVLRAV